MFGHLAYDFSGGACIVLDICLCPACECEAGFECIHLFLLVVYKYKQSLTGTDSQSAFVYS